MHLQAMVRGFLDRLRLKRTLAREAEEQKKAIKDWSILILQKIARGYIARKTIIRSMKIRKNLRKEVLRIAEKYLAINNKSGNPTNDIWGFLDEVNRELQRVHNEMDENTLREDDWATQFVSRVVGERQKEFNNVWDTFPNALAKQLEKNQSNAGDRMVGTLLFKSGNQNALKSTGGNEVSASASLERSNTAPQQTSSKSSTKSKKGSTAKEITVNEVATAMRSFDVDGNKLGKSTSGVSNKPKGPDRFENTTIKGSNAEKKIPPGPLIRKALETTVQVEVTNQLNILMNGHYRSRRLANDIKSVYGPESVVEKKSGVKLPSLGSKKKKSFDGKEYKPVGKIQATHKDWLTDTAQNADQVATNALVNKETTAEVVQPGLSLLLDIPRGLEDSIERLIHAAALRCYVPDFFRGAPKVANKSSNDGNTQQMVNEEEEDMSLASLDSKKRRKKREESIYNEDNADPKYAYEMYLQMPIGLAKMRYELECKKWSQGVINRLRVKGLNYLTEVYPVSKFIMCLKSVDAPRLLINKCVDIFVDLKNMGKAPLGSIAGTANPIINPPESKVILDEDGDVYNPTSTTALSDSLPKPILSNRGAALALQAAADAGSTMAKSKQKSITFQNTTSPVKSTAELQIEDEQFPSHQMISYDNQEDANRRNSLSTIGSQSSASTLLVKPPPLLEQASQMLQNMIENVNQADWCSLQAQVEDIFIQAAFLIVPHTPVHNEVLAIYRKVWSTDNTSSLDSSIFEGNESDAALLGRDSFKNMGNHAFKLYAMDLFLFSSSEEKEDFVRARFRAAVILTTPFTLYLKSKNITTVQQLLGIELLDLALPKPLFTQLEILLNIVVNKSMKAQMLPIPRDHGSLRETDFMVPMFYDTRFQRTPLDVFGRAPKLPVSSKGNHSNKKGSSTIRKHLRRDDVVNEGEIRAMEDVHRVRGSKAVIEQDLDEELQPHISLWSHEKGTNNPLTLSSGVKASNSGLSNASFNPNFSSPSAAKVHPGEDLDEKWSFVPDYRESNSLAPSDMSVSQLEGGSLANTSTDKSSSAMTSKSKKSKTGRIGDVSVAYVEDDYTESDSSQLETLNMSDIKGSSQELVHHSSKGRISSPQKVAKPYRYNNEKDFVTDNLCIFPPVFKETYVCHFPNCGQVFSRNYTYKVHLKSHDMFPQYHSFKKNPQVALDHR